MDLDPDGASIDLQNAPTSRVHHSSNSHQIQSLPGQLPLRKCADVLRCAVKRGILEQ